MTVLIVQARMGSSRLPGKVLLPIDARPMLSYQLERLRRVKLAARIVIATTDQSNDDPIVRFCAQERVLSFRGSEHDVLARFHGAASRERASSVVRVTADCPLIDPELIDSAIQIYRESDCDYVSNMLEPTWPYGMAVEVISFSALDEAQRESQNAIEREHVTPFIYWRPERYRLKSLTMTPNLSVHRWTVDTPDDFELVSRIVRVLYPRNPNFSMEDVLTLLREHPDWVNINRDVKQIQIQAP